MKKIKVNQKQKNHQNFTSIHSSAAMQALRQVRETPLSTFITCAIIAMTLVLTTTLTVTLKTFEHIASYVKNSNQLIVYLKPEGKEFEIEQWLTTLKQKPVVKEITYISKEQALKELANQPDYNEILANIPDNPLPSALLIKLNTDDKALIEPLVNNLKASPFTVAINFDFDWLKRLSIIIWLLRRVSLALEIVFAVGVLLIVNHAIRSATQRNQQEIQLLQLIGASTPYIRKPFIYLGVLLGVGAGLITVSLLIFITFAIKQPLTEFLTAYHLQSQAFLLDFQVLWSLLTVSTLLGVLGAWLSFNRYAKIA